jgi:predicted unusual protein kinase regulating ubiquinone biosynthesis (AarF/ABC1/UbiB family)
MVARQRQAECEAVIVAAPPPPNAALRQLPQGLAARALRTAAAAKRWVALVVRSLLRLLRHAWVLGPAVAVAPVAFLSGGDQRWWWELLVARAERSGPALLKFFQWAATRRDLFPPLFCDAASRLQDRTRVPHRAGWAAARATLDGYLRPSPADGPACWRWVGPEGGEYLLDMAPPLAPPSPSPRSSSSSSRSSSRNSSRSSSSSSNSSSSNSSEPEPRLLGSGCVAQVFKGRLVRVRTAAMVARARAAAAATQDLDGSYLTSGVVEGGAELGAGAFCGAARDDDGDDDHTVAVKVLMPGVGEDVELDLALLGAAARCLEGLPFAGLRWLDLAEAVAQFKEVMTRQLDLADEATSLGRLRANFGQSDPADSGGRAGAAGAPWASASSASRVTFPAPLLASRRVLVESFEPGRSVAALARCGSGDGDDAPLAFKKDVAARGLAAFLTMLFDHNFAHGDLHPGNVLLRPRAVRQARQASPPASPPASPAAAASEQEGSALAAWAARAWQRLTGSGESGESPRSHEGKCATGGGVGTHADILRESSVSSATAGNAGEAEQGQWFGPGGAPYPGLGSGPVSSGAGYELVLIDGGIVVELGPREADCLVDLFAAIVTGDGARAGRLMLDRSRKSECADPEAFVAAIAKLIDDTTGSAAYTAEGSKVGGGGQKGVRLSAVQVGTLLAEVLGLCRQHRVLLESRFASTVAAIAVLEGLGRSLDPDLDILAVAAPVVLRAAARRQARRLFGSGGSDGSRDGEVPSGGLVK